MSETNRKDKTSLSVWKEYERVRKRTWRHAALVKQSRQSESSTATGHCSILTMAGSAAFAAIIVDVNDCQFRHLNLKLNSIKICQRTTDKRTQREANG